MRFLRSAVPSFLVIVGALIGVAWGTAYVSDNVAKHQEYEVQIDQLRQELVELQGRVDTLEATPIEPLPDPVPQVLVRPGRPDPAKVYAVPVGDSPILGNTNALVTVIEFVDYQCPFCKRSQNTLDEVRDHYGDDVRIVFKHNPLPFHRQAEPAAQAAQCAEQQGKFWNMSELLWANGRDLNDDTSRSLAKKIGLNMRAFDSCLAQGANGTQIATDKKTAQRFGARGTPAFFVNGRFLSGAQPFQKFSSLIDEELLKARSSEVLPRNYYDVEVMQKGETEVN